MKIKKIISILIIEILLIFIMISSVFTYYKNGKNVARAYSNYILNEISKYENFEELEELKDINLNFIPEIKKSFIKTTIFNENDIDGLSIRLNFYNYEYVKKNYEQLGLKKDLSINKNFFRQDKFLNIFKLYSVKFKKLYKANGDITKIIKISSDNKKIFYKSLTKAFIEFLIASLIIIILILYAWNKALKIFKRWMAIIFNNSDEGIYVYLFVLLIIPLLLFIPSLIKYWYIYYALIVLYIFSVPLLKLKANMNRLFIIFSIIVVCIASLQEIFINFGYIGTRMNLSIINRFQMIAIVAIGIYLLLRRISLEERFLGFIIITLSLSFIEFRASLSLLSLYGALFFLIYIYLIDKLVFLESKKFKFEKIINFIVLILILYLGTIFAFRTDWLFFAEKGFHASYYVAPILSIENGYMLLSDQPSQYGFLNILFPYLININSPLNSFHIFQSSLLVLVIFFSIITFYKVLKIRNFSWAIFTFTMLLIFSDPMLIGPNAYPSCSVVRFFPVYVFLLINLYLFKSNVTGNLSLIINSFLACFSFLWSAEAFYYILFPIIFQYALNTCINIKDKKIIKNNFLSLLKFILFFILFTSFALYIYKSLFQIESLDLSLLFIHTLGYGKGYAVMPIDALSPIFVLLIPIIYVISKIKHNKMLLLRFSFYVSIVLALITYYVARSVPNNLNALWPLIFIIFTVAFYDMKNLKCEKKILKFIILPVVLIGSLCLTNFTINFHKNYDGYEAMNGFKSSSFYINHFDFSYDFNLPIEHKDIENKLFLISKNKINLSILTAGSLNNNLIKSGNIKPFLPSPIMLLAKPLSDNQIANIISKSPAFKSKEGFVLYDNKWDHFDELIKEVRRIKLCKMIIYDERFKLYNCSNRN
tara:strand:- start:1752 stop:4382 length:2631 start_codon:yes stop_codon:yes gene_type:complete